MIQIDVYERQLTQEEIVNRYKNRDTTLTALKKKRKLLFNKIKKLNHQLLISYLDYIEEDGYIIFIKEQFGRTLEDFVKTTYLQHKVISLQDISKIIYQLFGTIDYLEHKGIILKSITSKQVLINESFDIKITDYALGILFTSSELPYHNEIKYIPPEFIFHSSENKINSSVIWSIGILILELLIDPETFNSLACYYNTSDYINDYITILIHNKDTSLLNKKNIMTLLNSTMTELLIKFLSGQLIRQDLFDEDLFDLIYNCLIVNCNKRKQVKELLNHSFCNKYNILSESNIKIVILPIDKEYLLKSNQDHNDRIQRPNSQDNYEILTRICKISIFTLLNHIINYKSKLIAIPTYCSLSPHDNKKISELYNTSLNISNSKNNVGKVNLIGSYEISFPLNYSDEKCLLLFIKDNNITIPLDKLKQEIDNYFKMKYRIGCIIYQLNNSKKEDLIVEIKHTNCYIPNTYRMLAYAILLDVDYFNDREYVDFSTTLTVPKEDMNQITKDLVRCGELNPFFKCSEYQHFLKTIFSALIINNDDFFYVQGMDSILIGMASICSFDIDMTYSLFYEFNKKTLFHFYDNQTHLIKDLQFHHLIIKRLIAYYDPQLYLYFQEKKIFDIQYSSNWFLSLFSRSFNNANLFRIWDILLINESNIIYIVIISILLMLKGKIINLSFDDIILSLTNLDEIDTEELVTNTLNKYQCIPPSLILMVYEYNPNLVNELKQNEFFQNRWWDLCDFYVNDIDINVPIIFLEDVMKIYEKVVFVDIRPKEQWEKTHITKSLNYDINSYDNGVNYLKSIEKAINNQCDKDTKIIVLVGDQSSKYNEIINSLLRASISNITIMKGGIDIVMADEISLIFHKKK